MSRWLPLAIGCALAAGPAAALDLTGTWVGKFTCSEFDGAAQRFAETGEALRITQTGNDVNVEWVGVSAAGVATFTGTAIPDAKAPDTKGEAALLDCGSSADVLANYSEIVRLAAKVNREKGKGSLKGLTIYSPVGLVAGSCKASFKLVDPADPGVGGCQQ